MRYYGLTILLLISFLTVFSIFLGCSNTSSSITSPNIQGEVNVKMQVVTKAPIGYGAPSKHATPTTLIDDPISDGDLVGCAMIISSVEFVTADGKSYPVFQARYREDGAIVLIDHGANNQVCSMINSAPSKAVTATNFLTRAEDVSWLADVGATEYKYVKIKIEEVCASYKTQSGTIVSWHDSNYSKTIMLEAGNQFSPFSITNGSSKNFVLKFNLSGRIGKVQGEFEPDVYLIEEN
jgi:hypothetical protein